MSKRFENPGRGSEPGRGHQRPVRIREPATAPSARKKFSGLEDKLPTLNFGSGRDQPVEFLRIIGEHGAVKYHHAIANVFRSKPPAYGDDEEESEYPVIVKPEFPTQYEKTVIACYINDMKVWTADQRKIEADRKIVYAVVMGQLSDSSRGELHDEDFEENDEVHNLLYLIKRIRATHIAVQSGNSRQDEERVRAKWYTMTMSSHESIHGFRKRVDEYQMERESVGLEVIPESELVIGILNRLDLARFSALVSTYL